MSFPLTILARRPILHFTDATDLRTLYDIAVDWEVRLKVIGNPDNGAYEWLIERRDQLVHSDCGYGGADIALRDGLLVYFDDPSRPVDVADLKRRAVTVAIKPRGSRS